VDQPYSERHLEGKNELTRIWKGQIRAEKKRPEISLSIHQYKMQMI
jgi:hypothetical protein